MIEIREAIKIGLHIASISLSLGYFANPSSKDSRARVLLALVMLILAMSV